MALLALAIGLTCIFRTVDAGGFCYGTAFEWSVDMLTLTVLFITLPPLRDSTATIRLGLDGLLDRRWSLKVIGWQNFAEFDPVRWFGIPAVQLRLVAPELDPSASLFARLARAFGLAPGDAVLVRVPCLDCTAVVLVVRILEIGTAAILAVKEAEAWAASSEYAAPPHS